MGAISTAARRWACSMSMTCRITAGILTAILLPDSHIRLANLRTPQTQSSLMMRRGYSYSAGRNQPGQLDMGLLFVRYQHDLEKGFPTVQNALTAKRWRSMSNLSAVATSLCYRALSTASTSWRNPV